MTGGAADAILANYNDRPFFTNAIGIRIIKRWEGLVDGDPDTPGLQPYRDPIEIPTIGYGSIWDMRGKRITMRSKAITVDDAESLLVRSVGWSEKSIHRLISAPLHIDQFSALVSFTYNVGGGALQRSTLRQKLNRHDYEGAANEFWKWRRAGGRILRGLVARRADEETLFREGTAQLNIL